MVIKYGKCEECGNEDITGHVACAPKGKQQLCPTCAAKYVVADVALVRGFMITHNEGTTRRLPQLEE
jgi:hypothetical protein